MVKNGHFSKADLHQSAYTVNYKYVVEEPSAILGHYSSSIYCNGRLFDEILNEGYTKNGGILFCRSQNF